MNLITRTSLSLLIFLFVSVVVFSQSKADRVALVIGNASYEDNYLKNPINDAIDMSIALRELGFFVIKCTDLDKKKMYDSIEKYSSYLKNASISFFTILGMQFKLMERTILFQFKQKYRPAQILRLKVLYYKDS